MKNKLAFSALMIMLLLQVSLAQPYETETAEDIMECWKKKSAGPSSENDCNTVTMKVQEYRCCYLSKTSRQEGNEVKKSCERLLFNEDSIRDYRDRLRDEYKDITILCAAKYWGGVIMMLIISLSII